MDAMNGGIDMMKFSVNHPWKFIDWKLAYATGLLQIVAVVATELATYFMLLFAADAMLDVLANYAIVLVIVDFGGYFYALNPNTKNKEIITKEKYKQLFKWEVTTSKSAMYPVPGNKMEPEYYLPKELQHLRPQYIYMGWSDRDCSGKTLYAIFRATMIIYNAIWYYFAPFMWKLGTFLWVLKKNHALAEIIGAEGEEGGSEGAAEGGAPEGVPEGGEGGE